MVIREANEGSARGDFVALAGQIYQNDPHYCPPLRLHHQMMLRAGGPQGKQFWVAYPGFQPVARLAVRRHRSPHGEALHFGFYESQEVGSQATLALVEAARARFPGLPLRGPFHFRHGGPLYGTAGGRLRGGPQFFMPYNPPYYDGYLQASGLQPMMDLYCYGLEPGEIRRDFFSKKYHEGLARGFKLRQLNKWRLLREARPCR